MPAEPSRAGRRGPAATITPTMDDRERTAMLAYGVGPLVSRPDETCLDDLERYARSTPSALAFVSPSGTLDYRALLASVEALAGVLDDRGVRPGDTVGVAVERGPDALIAPLAIWRGGGVYVPLDVSYPAERLASILADSHVRVLITDGSARPTPDFDGPRVVPGEVAPRRSSPRHSARPDDLAYVIYTSGSTGRPKGVEVTHHALRNTLGAKTEMLSVGPADTLLAVMSVAFDTSLFELLLPLHAGARLAMATHDEMRDAARLAARMSDVRPGVMGATPATWHALLEVGWPIIGPLRMMCGGEALSADLARRLREKGRVWNMYGLTETAITAIAHEVGDEPAEVGPPIGSPIANVVLRVVDDTGALCPVGVAGELYVGGAGLARGYHERPALTAERFTPDPIGASRGRFYRTGDLVRWRGDGALEFLGRTDDQIKVNGVRIEPAEIEAALGQHAQVAGCAVTVRRAGRGATLVAHYVPRAPVPAVGALRAHLAARLPVSMLPAMFVAHSALPLSPNGKIDRRALTEIEPIAPATAIADTRLAAFTATVEKALGAGTISAETDLMTLGIDSLTRARLVASLAGQGFRVHAGDLDDHPTPASLLAYLDLRPPLAPAAGSTGRRASEAADSLSAAEAATLAGRIDGLVEATPAGAGETYMLVRGQVNQPVALMNVQYRYEFDGQPDIERLRAAWARVVSRHASLRASVEWQGLARPVRVVRRHVPESFAIHDWRGSSPAGNATRLEALARGRLHRRFVLDRPPFYTLDLVVGPARTSALVFTCHDIELDGLSVAMLFDEVWRAYEADPSCAREEAIATPLVGPDPGGDEGAASERFWRGELEGLDRQTLLPFDKRFGAAPWARATREAVRSRARVLRNFLFDRESRALVHTFEALHRAAVGPDAPRISVLRRLSRLASVGSETIFGPLPSTAHASLEGRARTLRVTVGSVLLATLALWLMRELGRRDVAIGLPTANRTPETMTSLGMFSGFVLFRARAHGDEQVAGWLQAQHRHVGELLRFSDISRPALRRLTGLPMPISHVEFVEVPPPPTPGAPLRPRSFSTEGVFAELFSVIWTPGPSPNIQFAFSPAHFAADTVEGWRRSYFALLNRIVTSGDGTVDAILSAPCGAGATRG